MMSIFQYFKIDIFQNMKWIETPEFLRRKDKHRMNESQDMPSPMAHVVTNGSFVIVLDRQNGWMR